VSTATALPSSPRPQIALVLAWRRYLVRTRTAAPGSYERVEERAWRELQRELAKAEARRRAVV
jgi:hypothetical protein